MKKSPHILIIGAPNVGKSTLFNRLIGHRKAVVSKEPGVTRDLIYGRFKISNHNITLIDSGGMIPDVVELIPYAIQRKILAVMIDCSLILFLVDVRKGLTLLDEEITAFLKKSGQKVLLCINKVDAFSLMDETFPFYVLGFDDPVAISSEHGLGINDILERIQQEILSGYLDLTDEGLEHEIKVIIMGKQNVGKSSLLNAVTRSDRMIVTEIPGTTVDSVDTLLETGHQRYRFIDTAGIRKKKSVIGNVEKIGVIKAKQNLKDADIVILVLDSQEGISFQDVSIAGYITQLHKPIVLAFNKWDLIENKKEASKIFKQQVTEKFRFLKSPPIVFVSALTRTHIQKVFPAVDALYKKYSKKIPTPDLNRVLLKIVKQYRAFSSSSSSFHLKYITQIGVRPQQFLIFAKNARRISTSLRRFLENSIKSHLDLHGIPIKLSFRESKRVSLKRKNK